MPNFEKQKPVTNRELSRWLAQGNGQCVDLYGFTSIQFYYDGNDDDEPISTRIEVRKWNDTAWHKPTREYMGLED